MVDLGLWKHNIFSSVVDLRFVVCGDILKSQIFFISLRITLTSCQWTNIVAEQNLFSSSALLRSRKISNFILFSASFYDNCFIFLKFCSIILWIVSSVPIILSWLFSNWRITFVFLDLCRLYLAWFCPQKQTKTSLWSKNQFTIIMNVSDALCFEHDSFENQKAIWQRKDIACAWFPRRGFEGKFEIQKGA